MHQAACGSGHTLHKKGSHKQKSVGPLNISQGQ